MRLRNHCGCRSYIGLSGAVTGTNGLPAPEMTVNYESCFCKSTTETNRQGIYSICVPCGKPVTVRLQTGIGVTVTPSKYFISKACQNRSDLDFVLKVPGPV